MVGIAAIDPETPGGEFMGERAAHSGDGLGGAAPGRLAAGWGVI